MTSSTLFTVFRQQFCPTVKSRIYITLMSLSGLLVNSPVRQNNTNHLNLNIRMWQYYFIVCVSSLGWVASFPLKMNLNFNWCNSLHRQLWKTAVEISKVLLAYKLILRQIFSAIGNNPRSSLWNLTTGSSNSASEKNCE